MTTPEPQQTELMPVDQAVIAHSAMRQPSMLETVMQAAMNPSIDADKMEKLLKMARELELDKKKQEWATAFRAAKDEIDNYKITKRGQIVYEGKGNKQGGIVRFIKYDDVSKAIKPILARNQLTASYTFRYETSPAKAICIMKLLHANGYFELFESIPLPMVDSSGGKNDVQGAGSVMSYGRRYAVCAAFDIVAENEDQDGAGVNLTPITEMQLADLNQFVSECEAKEPGFTGRFKRWLVKEIRVEDPKDLCQGEQYKTVMAKLSEKCRDLGI